MSEQNIEYERTKIQNQILDLEEKYMHIIEEIVTSPVFLADLRHLEEETQEYYELLQASVLTEKMELIPVPRNAGYSENPKETSIANPNIENFIHNHAIIYRSTNTTN